MSLSGYSEGDTATYICNEGYELVGTPVINCEDGGTWDDPPPTCTREFPEECLSFKIFCSFSTLSALCPDQENPANGVVSQSGNSVGDMATYTCNDGYELVGPEVINCQNDGTWDNSPPVCKRVLIQQPSRAPSIATVFFPF